MTEPTSPDQTSPEPSSPDLNSPDLNSPDPMPQAAPVTPDPAAPESLWLRGVWMLIIAAMISLAQTVLFLATVVQFILMLTGGRKPNGQLSDFGATLGQWLADAARFQTASSDSKPWPWKPLA